MIALKIVPLFCAASLAWPQEPVNAHALVIEDFQRHAAEYVKLHQKADAELPRLKPTDSPAAIAHHEHKLAHRIREMRRSAKAGDIFTLEITGEFHRLIGIAMQGRQATHVRQSLKHAEPVRLPLRVNDPYPADVPLQSTPPTLLLNLPMLPMEVDYRVVDHALVLRDVGANMIVDFIAEAIP